MDETFTMAPPPVRRNAGMAALRREKHAVDVHFHDPPPACRILVQDIAATADTDIVVEHIEPSPQRDGRGDHRIAVSCLGDIGFECVGNAARILNHGDRPLRQCDIAIHAENARARDCK